MLPQAALWKGEEVNEPNSPLSWDYNRVPTSVKQQSAAGTSKEQSEAGESLPNDPQEYEQMKAIRTALSVSRSPLRSPVASPSQSREGSVSRDASLEPSGHADHIAAQDRNNHNATVTRVRLEAEDQIKHDGWRAAQQALP